MFDWNHQYPTQVASIFDFSPAFAPPPPVVVVIIPSGIASNEIFGIINLGDREGFIFIVYSVIQAILQNQVQSGVLVGYLNNNDMNTIIYTQNSADVVYQPIIIVQIKIEIMDAVQAKYEPVTKIIEEN